jgi:hypothetical protein
MGKTTSECSNIPTTYQLHYEEGDNRATNNISLKNMEPIYPNNEGPPPQIPIPPYGFAFESRTERGLKFMLRGMMLFGVFAGMILTIISISNITSTTTTAPMIFFAITTVAIMFISIILWIAGYYNIFRARREFGPVHMHYVNLSIIFAGLYVLSLIGHAFILIIGFRFMSGNLFFIRMIPGIISSALLALVWIYPILDIVPSEMKVTLWISLFLSLVVSSTSAFIGESSAIAGFYTMALWYIVLFIVILCYQRTYNRLKKKEILPIFPPPIPYPLPPP